MFVFKVFSRCLTTAPIESVRQFLKKHEGGFSCVIEKMNIIDCGNGMCTAKMKIEEKHTNQWKSLHGGLSATIVDMTTGIALFTHKSALKLPTVSIDMHLTYLNSIGIGEEVVIDAHVLNINESIAYTTCEFRNKATGDIVIKGSHARFIIS